MALFFHSYIYIPESDRNKTVLKQGNPYRLDHFILGVSFCTASLYKPPKQPRYQSFWLWDDPDFDPYDIQPSEFIVTKQIYDVFNREMERVQQDQNTDFNNHFVVGTGLVPQLAFFTQRTIHFRLQSSDLIYYTFQGATPIDLGTVAKGKNTPAKHLKPLYVPNEIKKSQSIDFLAPEEVYQLYDDFAFDTIEKRANTSIQGLVNYYYSLKSSS